MLLNPSSKIFNWSIRIVIIICFAASLSFIFHRFQSVRVKALNFIRPEPMNLLWDVNINGAPMDLNQLRIYADYYEHMVHVFPTGFSDANGILGYSYYYFGDDSKAIKYLETARKENPYYFWYAYNLALIEIHQGNVVKAKALLNEALNSPPQTNIRTIVESVNYPPLLGKDLEKAFPQFIKHLEQGYRDAQVLSQILASTDESNASEIVHRLKLEPHAF